MANKLAPLLILLLFLFFSWLTASPWPDGQDGVNFLLGVELYDVTFHRPHFPGYPVYIAFGKLFTYLSLSPEWALVSLSIFAGASTILIFYFFVKPRFSKPTAILLSLLLAANPVFFEFSHKISTEPLGLLFLVGALYTLGSIEKGARWLFACALLGLMLGVRLSWWPFAFVYLVASVTHKQFFKAIIGFLIGVLAWLIPQIIIIGPGELYQTGVSFVAGHFGQWGGAIGATGVESSRAISIGVALLKINGAIGVWGFAISWITLTVIAIFSFRKYTFNKSISLFFGASLLYFAWISFGQNVNNVRHFLPLIPGFILLNTYAIPKRPKIYWVALVSLWLIVPFNYFYRTHTAPPAARLHQWLANGEPTGTALYCGEAERFFDIYNIDITVVNVNHIDQLEKIIASTWPAPTAMLVCDDIHGARLTGAPVATFPARFGDPSDKTLKVYNFISER